MAGKPFVAMMPSPLSGNSRPRLVSFGLELAPDRRAGAPLQIREIDVAELRAVGGAQRYDNRDVVVDQGDDAGVADAEAPQKVVGQLAAARRARISCELVDGVQNAPPVASLRELDDLALRGGSVADLVARRRLKAPVPCGIRRRS